jgi:hypothetical protein
MIVLLTHCSNSLELSHSSIYFLVLHTPSLLFSILLAHCSPNLLVFFLLSLLELSCSQFLLSRILSYPSFLKLTALTFSYSVTLVSPLLAHCPLTFLYFSYFHFSNFFVLILFSQLSRTLFPTLHLSHSVLLSLLSPTLTHSVHLLSCTLILCPLTLSSHNSVTLT